MFKNKIVSLIFVTAFSLGRLSAQKAKAFSFGAAAKIAGGTALVGLGYAQVYATDYIWLKGKQTTQESIRDRVLSVPCYIAAEIPLPLIIMLKPTTWNGDFLPAFNISLRHGVSTLDITCNDFPSIKELLVYRPIVALGSVLINPFSGVALAGYGAHKINSALGGAPVEIAKTGIKTGWNALTQ